MSEHRNHGPWSVWLNDTDRHEGRWTRLDVRPSNGAHVTEEDAEWLRQVLRDARHRPTAELLRERNEAEAKLEKVATIIADLDLIPGARMIAQMLDNVLFPCNCPGEHCGECGCCP